MRAATSADAAALIFATMPLGMGDHDAFFLPFDVFLQRAHARSSNQTLMGLGISEWEGAITDAVAEYLRFLLPCIPESTTVVWRTPEFAVQVAREVPLLAMTHRAM